MSRRLGLSKIKGAHTLAYCNYIYIYDSLEVVGEEYCSFLFLVHEEPHKIRAHVIHLSRCRVWILENDVRINKPNSIVVSGSELSYMEPAYSESIDKYMCKDNYYIETCWSLIKNKNK